MSSQVLHLTAATCLGLVMQLAVASGSSTCAGPKSGRGNSLLSFRATPDTVQQPQQPELNKGPVYQDKHPVYVKPLSPCSFRTATGNCSELDVTQYKCEDFYESGSGDICDGLLGRGSQTNETKYCQANSNMNCEFPRPCELLIPVQYCDQVSLANTTLSINCQAYYDEDFNICSNFAQVNGAMDTPLSCTLGSSTCMTPCLGLNNVTQCTDLAASDSTCEDFYEMQGDVHIICSSSAGNDTGGSCQASDIVCA